MAHTAYLLACAGMNFYAGYTPDITRRVFLHETGRGARYTRAHRPVRLVYTEEYATKSEAMRREAALKRLTHAQKAALAAPALAAWEYLAQRPACVDMLEALRWGKRARWPRKRAACCCACRGATFCWPQARRPRRRAFYTGPGPWRRAPCWARTGVPQPWPRHRPWACRCRPHARRRYIGRPSPPPGR